MELPLTIVATNSIEHIDQRHKFVNSVNAGSIRSECLSHSLKHLKEIRENIYDRTKHSHAKILPESYESGSSTEHLSLCRGCLQDETGIILLFWEYRFS